MAKRSIKDTVFRTDLLATRLEHAMTDDTPPDLQVFKANKQQEQIVQMMNNLQLLKDSMSAILEYQNVVAKIKFNKYQELVNAGFSEAQALTIVTQSAEIL